VSKWVALFIAALFACVSFVGFWFHIAAAPVHGLEIAIVAGALAVIAGVAGAWFNAGEPS